MPYNVFYDAHTVLINGHRNIKKVYLPFTFSISIDEINVPYRNIVIRFDITMKVSYCLYMNIDLIHNVNIKNFCIDVLERISQVTLSIFDY